VFILVLSSWMKLIRQMCTWSGAFKKKTFRENNRNTINKDENIIIGCYSHSLFVIWHETYSCAKFLYNFIWRELFYYFIIIFFDILTVWCCLFFFWLSLCYYVENWSYVAIVLLSRYISNCQMSKQRLINRNKSNLYALLSSNDEDKRV
jgi:hypothetical protein